MKSTKKRAILQRCIPSTFQSDFSITCTNDLFNLHTGYINLLGKLPHSLVGVLICERININLHSWSHLEKSEERL